MDSSSRLPPTQPMSEGHIELDWLLKELPAQYEILREVASGGMGSVYKARNRYTGANVAIKIMRTESAQNTTAIQRFYLEAKAAGLLKHPNICRLLDFGVSKSGMPYLVMDWVDGINLEKKVLNGYRFTTMEILAIFRQIASALSHAHQKKIIHRDLKPENIMISQNANGQIEIQLVDFGIAKMLGQQALQANAMTKIGIAVGTPAYMSPEQAKGMPVDPRTDIYSLGCVIYFALSGRPPFEGATTKQVMEKHVYDTPPVINPTLDIPQSLKTIIAKAMNKELVFRYQSMDQLLTDLDKLIGPPPGTVEATAVKTSPAKKIFLWILSFVIGFSIVYFGCQALLHVFDAQDQAASKKNSMAHHDER